MTTPAEITPAGTARAGTARAGTARAETSPRRVAVDEPRPRFVDLLAAEWIKLRSLRSIAWALGITAFAALGINLYATIADYGSWTHYDAETRAAFIPYYSMRDAFTEPAALAVLLGVGAVGAITVAGEYGTGLIRTTFAAVPDRRAVMAAKLAVVAVVTTVLGAVLSSASYALTQAILAGRHAGVSIGHPGAVRLVLGAALLAPVAAVAGMGVAAIVRNSAGTMVGLTAVLLLLPNILSDHSHAGALIAHAMPYNAWRRLSQVTMPPGEHVPYPWTVTGAWLVFAAWAAVSVAVVVVTVRHRDQ